MRWLFSVEVFSKRAVSQQTQMADGSIASIHDRMWPRSCTKPFYLHHFYLQCLEQPPQLQKRLRDTVFSWVLCLTKRKKGRMDIGVSNITGGKRNHCLSLFSLLILKDQKLLQGGSYPQSTEAEREVKGIRTAERWAYPVMMVPSRCDSGFQQTWLWSPADVTSSVLWPWIRFPRDVTAISSRYDSGPQQMWK